MVFITNPRSKNLMNFVIFITALFYFIFLQDVPWTECLQQYYGHRYGDCWKRLQDFDFFFQKKEKYSEKSSMLPAPEDDEFLNQIGWFPCNKKKNVRTPISKWTKRSEFINGFNYIFLFAFSSFLSHKKKLRGYELHLRLIDILNDWSKEKIKK